MQANTKRNFFTDAFRALLCIAVLFYHTGLLKGGYLAVCGFFVLSGFFAARSMDLKTKAGSFSLKKHYISRLKRIYLPLAVVCFITLAVVWFFRDILWITLKPETSSVLLGYNNFWQINANLDYFARHTSSPFMHFWYMGILLQFEAVFPLVFPALSRKKPELISGISAALFAAVFLIMNSKCRVMTVYYNTFSRCFSILLGIFSYFISEKKPYKLPPALFAGLTIFSAFLFISVDAASVFFAPAMLLVSLISCVICACPVDCTKLSGKHSRKEEGILGKIISYIASISYEVYLVQYPVIFFLQQLKGDVESLNPGALTARAASVTVLSFALAVFLKYSLKLAEFNIADILKSKIIKTAAPRIACAALALILCLAGAVKFVSEKDHTGEMKALEEQLAQEQLLMQQRQEEQAKKMAEEKAAFEAKLKELQSSEEGLYELAKSAPVTTIGDSVMLGASTKLCQKLTNCYCDAAVSRTAWVVKPIIQDLIDKNSLGDIVVMHLGTNGDGPEYLKEEIMELCNDKEVFWLSITNDKAGTVNTKLEKFTQKYNNAHFIDWNGISKGHSEYFGSDGIHLTQTGQAAYADAVFEAVYQLYLDRFNAEKEAYLKQAEETKNSQYILLGDELLMSLMQNEEFSKAFPAAKCISGNNLNAEDIKNGLKQAAEEDILTDHIVIALYSGSAEAADYEAIIRDYSHTARNRVRDFLFITLNDGSDISAAMQSRENVRLIDFSLNLKQNPDILHADKLHLTKDGLLELTDKILAEKNNG